MKYISITYKYEGKKYTTQLNEFDYIDKDFLYKDAISRIESITDAGGIIVGLTEGNGNR